MLVCLVCVLVCLVCVHLSYDEQITPQPAVNISEVLRGGCSGFASNAMKWPEQILVAG